MAISSLNKAYTSLSTMTQQANWAMVSFSFFQRELMGVVYMSISTFHGGMLPMVNEKEGFALCGLNYLAYYIVS